MALNSPGGSTLQLGMWRHVRYCVWQQLSLLLLLWCYHIQSCRGLKYGCKESSRERECWQPEDHRRMCSRRPLLKLVDTQHKITSPWRQRLHWWISLNTSRHQIHKVNVYLFSASSWSASNALPLFVHWRWSLQASPPARHSANTARSHDMPVYSPSFHSSLTTDGGFRLSTPGCLVLCRGGLPSKDGHPPRH